MAKLQIMLLGCGKMGSAMLKGWLADTCLDAQFTIIEPFADHLDWVRAHQSVAVYHDCEAAIGAEAPVNSVIVLAVKPQMMDEAIAAFGPLSDDKTAFLTIAAGISTAWLKARLGADAPVLRAMPNTPAAIGRGVTALYCDSAAAEMAALARQLLRTIGTVVAIDDETLMDAVTAVSGSGPAYFFLVMEAMQKSAEAFGFTSEQASLLVQQTAFGASKLAMESPDSAAVLREKVTSKGGTTEAAINQLQASGLEGIFDNALKAAANRSIVLSGGKPAIEKS